MLFVLSEVIFLYLSKVEKDHMSLVASCMKKGCSASKNLHKIWSLKANWIVSLSLPLDELVLNINTRSKKIVTQRAQFLQDRRTPYSIWPSMISSQLEKHVGSNWILSFWTWYEFTASQPFYPVTVHKFFSLYWLSLSIFLIRKGGG